MKAISVIGLLFIIILVFSSCMAGQNDLEKTPNKNGNIAGFLKGLWHGFITPITFIISIFTKHIRFYEVRNNGFWYNFGFVLGAGLFLSGGILGRGKRKRKK